MSDTEPPLIVSARRVVAESQYCTVDAATGCRIDDDPELLAVAEDVEDVTDREEPNGVLLDGFTASMLCQVYDAVKDKAVIQRCVVRWGVVSTVTRCWKAIKK